MIDLRFLGGAGTVTGSKTLVRVGDVRILVDCGLFQGQRIFRRRNWDPFPVPPKEIDAIVLTHAHIDHSGFIPRLVEQGFEGKVFCTEATRALAGILLTDCGAIQEEDAEHANRGGYSKHHPAEPLYTEKQAERALEQFVPVDWNTELYLGGRTTVSFSPAGHILGAACVSLRGPEGLVVASGDLGRPNDPIMRPPAPVADADVLIVESTYGDRSHPAVDVEQQLAQLVNRVVARHGVVIVPAFAVGRAQRLLYHLNALRARNAIPDVPIYLDSPMACDVTALMCTYGGEHRLDQDACRAAFSVAKLVRDARDSRAIDESHGPMIIVSASGMLTGGRVLHHVHAFGGDARNAILLAGYQGEGTRGADLQRGARALRMHGQMVPIHAEVVTMDTMSAHADAGEILAWLRGFEVPPTTTLVNHGEPSAAAALASRIESELGWRARVPTPGESFQLAGRDAGVVTTRSPRVPPGARGARDEDESTPSQRGSRGSEPLLLP